TGGDLDGGGVIAVADQPIGQPVCPQVGRAGPGDAELLVAEPAQILHGRQRAGRQHLDHRGTNRTRVPGVSTAGGCRLRSNSGTSVRPSSRQPPGVTRGYTPVNSSAMATEPAG